MLSIIIPVYNREDLFPATLDSILAQTRTDWECIVVDDHSDDGTVQIAEDYAKKDSRIKIFRRPDSMPKGASACRNYGFRHAEGEYIYFFDSDDLLAPEFIGTFLPPLENEPNLDFVNFRFNRFSKSPKHIVRVSPPQPRETPFIEVFAGQRIAVGTSFFLWRKKIIDVLPSRWREDISYGEDLEFNYRLLHSARHGISVDEPVLLYYRRNRKGISYTKRYNRNILESLFKVYKSLVETSLAFNDGMNVQNALSKTLRKQIRVALRFGDLDYLARFLQMAEQLTVSPQEARWFTLIRRHPFIALCLNRPVFLIEKFFVNIFLTTKNSKNDK